MLTNLANYLNNDFPFHMFFAVQILLAEGLFVVRMKSRLRPLKIVLPVVLCYLVLVMVSSGCWGIVLHAWQRFLPNRCWCCA